ncbi:multidrug ABC transporter permease [Sinomonas atrocyanea]|uniref:Multidrug ABC transporter permease n=1 Tax=Sinomonas atrocyanea TaxID=37927 RepID=A0A126ZW21_9MICC|nr:hypothetical protein [Sinomonas atrocyanea]AMM30741.1 multidrug ABC transporter permease [Sinomonas atrocyanea]GEB63787.1 ABC transporter membrane-spanning protein [Sinomonas atrocyanea]GGG74322.1 ABC transporter membrane-spanning protein [Sinomonas atrocyanea]
MSGFAGTGRLLLFALRLDRLRLAPWVLIIALFPFTVYNSYSTVFSGPDEARSLEQTLSTNPAFMLLLGPADRLDDPFGFTTWRMQVFGMFFAALMAVFAVTRHARAAEDTGQAELIDSGAVGQHARLAAAVLLAWIASAAVALVIGGTLAVSGARAQESFALGALIGGVGVTFAGIAAVTCQIGSYARTANTLAATILVLAYVVRGLADTLTGGEWALWTSPLGWAELVRPATELSPAPLALLVAAGAAAAGVGAWLAGRRDYGAGLVHERPGPTRWRAGVWGHTAALYRAPTLTWTAAFVFLGFVYGLVTGTLRDFYEGNAFIRQLLAAHAATEADLTFTFVSLLLLILALTGAVLGIQVAARFAAEEEEGRAEWLLSTAVSRQGYFVPTAVAALLAPSATFAVGGAVLAATSDATGAPIGAGDIVRQTLATLPALWLATAAGLALVGAAPLLRWIAWLLLVYWLLVTVFGPVLKAPDWLLDTSPFHVIPRVTAADADWAPVAWILAITAALLAAAVLGYRARSIRGA